MPEERGKQNREWVHAQYDPETGLKIPGTGIEVDKKTRAEIPNRGRNRPDQRYMAGAEELQARRVARAIAEEGDTLAVVMDEGRVEIVSANENRYDVSGPDQEPFCACPDWEKLTASFPDDLIYCKHWLIARMKEADAPDGQLPVGVLWFAEQIGINYATVQHLCRVGAIPAVKVKRTWVCEYEDAVDFVETYKERMYDPDFRETLAELLGVLVTGLDKVFPNV